MTPEELARAIEAAIAEAEAALIRAAGLNDSDALAELLEELGRLKISRGKISPTVENLKIKASIRAKLDKIIFGPAFQSGVASIVAGMRKVEKILNDYFTAFRGFNPGPAFSALVQSAIDSVRLTMSSIGWGSSVVNTVSDILETAVTNAMSPRELIRQLGDFIKQGGLQTFSRVSIKQIATDAMGQFARTYMKQASDRASLEWFRYSGVLVGDTRSFCAARNGKYFHRSEIEKWPGLSWDGKIKGTNSGNIFAYLGGWNCLHTLVPVAKSAVPKADLQRFQ